MEFNAAFGIIGTGKLANEFRAQVGRRLPRLKWFAYDLQPAASAQFSDRWRATAAPSLEALASQVGCVMIATPPGVRGRLLEEYLALRAGHATVVLLQNPVATSVAEVDVMQQIVGRYPNARCGVCLDRRPSAWWAADQIAAGAIGRPFEAQFGFTCVGASAELPPWCLDRDMSGGGGGIGLLGHPFDLFDTALQRPRILSVSAAALHRMIGPGGVEDSLIGMLRFDIDGGEPGVGLYRTSWEDKTEELGLVVGGTDGYLEISRTRHRDRLAEPGEPVYGDETLKSRIVMRARGPRNPIAPKSAVLSLADCRADQVAEALAVLAALEHGHHPETSLPTLHEAKRGLQLTVAAYAAAESGQTVHDVL